MSKANTIKIFDNQTSNGTSLIFTVNRPENKGYADTGFSAYIGIYGDLGGGNLSFQKKCLDGIFRELEVETNDITVNFPDLNKQLVKPINYKSDEEFKFVLSEAGAPTLFIDGINLKEAT